ncbi:MAG TPA: hypothetical protein VGH20_01170 [Myxococcales bacterium]
MTLRFAAATVGLIAICGCEKLDGPPGVYVDAARTIRLEVLDASPSVMTFVEHVGGRQVRGQCGSFSVDHPSPHRVLVCKGFIASPSEEQTNRDQAAHWNWRRTALTIGTVTLQHLDSQ